MDPLDAELEAIVNNVGINAARKHILLCCDQTKCKCCTKEEGLVSWNFLKNRLKELGLVGQGGIFRSKANCLRICQNGPIRKQFAL